jgi:hypothetical protein
MNAKTLKGSRKSQTTSSAHLTNLKAMSLGHTRFGQPELCLERANEVVDKPPQIKGVLAKLN